MLERDSWTNRSLTDTARGKVEKNKTKQKKQAIIVKTVPVIEIFYSFPTEASTLSKLFEMTRFAVTSSTGSESSLLAFQNYRRDFRSFECGTAMSVCCLHVTSPVCNL